MPGQQKAISIWILSHCSRMGDPTGSGSSKSQAAAATGGLARRGRPQQGDLRLSGRRQYRASVAGLKPVTGVLLLIHRVDALSTVPPMPKAVKR
ncbi:hypothetical protein PoB_006293000 [Plakobranchus ocellatus]|uniref:Uncharacterized protein n=1 Tax=Plakobranchus ocellatus TaxID=259542 RepID=A0AAV4CXC8_9GAST|nr:hypothetical protein PoB_006293000 [Plakobranchus ocellatus]